MDILVDYGSSPSPMPGVTPDSNGISDPVNSMPQSPTRQQDLDESAIVHNDLSESLLSPELFLTPHFVLDPSMGFAEALAVTTKAIEDDHDGPQQSPPGGGSGGVYLTPLEPSARISSPLPWMLAVQNSADSQAHAQVQAVPVNGTIDPSLLVSVRPLEPDPDLDPEALLPSPVSETTSRPSRPRQPSVGSTSRSRGRTGSVAPTLSEDGSESSSSSSSDDDRPLAERLPVRTFPFALPRELPQLQPQMESGEGSGKRSRRQTERARAMVNGLDLDSEFEEGYSSSLNGESGKGKGKGKDKGAAKGKGKGKGKEKGKGKGKGKATAQGEVESAGKAKGKGPGKGAVSSAADAGGPKPQTPRKLAEEPTFCHQCRSKTTREKMRCTTVRDTGERCGLRYCDRCVGKRSVSTFSVVRRCIETFFSVALGRGY